MKVVRVQSLVVPLLLLLVHSPVSSAKQVLLALLNLIVCSVQRTVPLRPWPPQRSSFNKQPIRGRLGRAWTVLTKIGMSSKDTPPSTPPLTFPSSLLTPLPTPLLAT